MKKILFTITMLVSVTVLFFAFSMSASAETYGDLTYEVSDGEVTITDCDKSATAVEIPTEINGYPVTAIGVGAFEDCSVLASVSISDSVTSIGEDAFVCCRSLEKIFIPDSVTSIDEGAFWFCDALEIVYYGGSEDDALRSYWAFNPEPTFYYDHEHDYDVTTTGICTEKGIIEYLCECGYFYSQEVDVLGHTEIRIPGKNATCTETGISEGKKCSVCNEILVAQEEIPAMGHLETSIAPKEPTCAEAGYTDGIICGICQKIIVATKEIPATGHTPGKWEVVKAAQVGQKGLEQQRCTVCNTVVNERDIPALPEESTKPVEKPTDKPVEKPDAVKNFGDVDGNGKITAADARLALRISAKLEKATELQTSVADMDKNGKITAADARKILRVSAKLETI